MLNLQRLLAEVATETFKVTTTSGGKEKVQQTQRNALRARFLDALGADLAEIFEGSGRVKDGILIEIPNESIASGISRDSIGSGALTIQFDVTIKDLDTDLQYEVDTYAEDCEQKAQARAERSAKAQAKKAERA